MGGFSGSQQNLKMMAVNVEIVRRKEGWEQILRGEIEASDNFNNS